MADKSPVSFLQNIWFDSEQVDDSDLNLEQDYNTSIHASFVNNHVGSGVLLETMNQNIIFDSDGYIALDGKDVVPQSQPTNKNYGNQLEVELTGSLATGKRKVKVAIIGLDFNGNLQFDTFYFSKNEKQYTKKHYVSVLLILFNDFLGPKDVSFNLGGRIVIREAPPFLISRDPIMVAQNIEPNLFFRDFFTTTTPSLQKLLSTSLANYNTDNLNIFIGLKENKVLPSGDVTTQIGQKFLATTNNIQKIRLLLSVQSSTSDPNNIKWSGDIIVSVYQLQSNISSSFDIVPDNAIDFSPSNIPLAQLSFNYNSLRDQLGVILDSTPQPVDFVFSNTVVGSGRSIIPGNYYAVCVKRSGSDEDINCDILLACGSNHLQNSKVTIFSDGDWSDLPEENLWFEVYNDAIKITDGQAYETGRGLIIDKVKEDESTGGLKDYCLDSIYFTGTQKYTAVAQAITEKSVPVQHQRTGNNVFSRKQFKPEIKLLTSTDLKGLSKTSQPLAIGTVVDDNQKYVSDVGGVFLVNRWSLLKNKIAIKIDSSSFNLKAAALQGSLLGSKITPNNSISNIFYRVTSSDVFELRYGDLNGDGIVDQRDLDFFDHVIGFDFKSSPPLNSDVSFDSSGNLSYKNGYTSLTEPFINDSSLVFNVVDVDTKKVVQVSGVNFTGNTGVLSAGSQDSYSATFSCALLDFSSILNINRKVITIQGSSFEENNGVFRIHSLNSSDTINIFKIKYDLNLIKTIMSADIDGDSAVSVKDRNYVEAYVDRVRSDSAQRAYSSFDNGSYDKIGKSFDVVVLTLENFLYNDSNSASPSDIDRNDDYPKNKLLRGSSLHSVPDIMKNDVSLFNRNFTSIFYSGSTLNTSGLTNYVTASGVDFKSLGVVVGDIIRAYNVDFDVTRKIINISDDGLTLYLDDLMPTTASSCSYEIIKNNPVVSSYTKNIIWDETLIRVNGYARSVPTVFQSYRGNAGPDTFDPGSVDCYSPNNIILGDLGEIKRKDGNYYKVDFEVGSIVIEIPDGFTTSDSMTISDAERVIYLFSDFVCEDPGSNGLTKKGFRAMRFADGSLVSHSALARNQVRFSVSVQSFAPNTDGEDSDGYRGVIVDGRIGVAIDHRTGILTLDFANLKNHIAASSLTTKIQVDVFLKKGGFNNVPLFIDSKKTQNILKLASVFTGTGTPRPGIIAPTIRVNLSDTSNVLGVLDTSRGGTGCSTVGQPGTVLTSNGSSLVYEKKNQFSLIAFSGVTSTTSKVPKAVGAFTFNKENISLLGSSSIVLEAILEATNPSNAAQIRLYSVDTNSYIRLGPVDDFISSNATSAFLIKSSDLFTELHSASPVTDYVYEIHLSLTDDPVSGASDMAICKMAGLSVNYGGPASLPPTPAPAPRPLILNTTSITSNYAMLVNDTFVSIGSISSSIQITLPPPSAVGQQIFIKDSNGTVSTSNYVDITGGVVGTIDGSTSIRKQTPYFSLTLIYDGSKWCQI